LFRLVWPTLYIIVNDEDPENRRIVSSSRAICLLASSCLLAVNGRRQTKTACVRN